MRAERPGFFRNKTLRAQADIPRTFASLLIPLVLILVGAGAFQLNRALAHPLESDAIAILFGSVLLACGLLLGIYLVRGFRIACASAGKEKQEREAAAIRDSPGQTRIVSRGTQPPRPFPGHYVDDTRISR